MAKNSKRKFYRTQITFTVLSEDPIPSDMSLDRILEETDSGDMVGYETGRETNELTRKGVVDALNDAGSDSTFFQLDENGNDIE